MTSRAGPTILERILDGREPLLDLMSEYRAAIEQDVRDDIRALEQAAEEVDGAWHDEGDHVEYHDDLPERLIALRAAISSSSATETQDGERPRHGVIEYDDHDEWLTESDVEGAARIVARNVPRWFGRLVEAALATPTPDDRDREVERIARALPGEVQPFTTESGLTLDGMLLVGNRESIAATIVENLRLDAGLRASGGTE